MSDQDRLIITEAHWNAVLEKLESIETRVKELENKQSLSLYRLELTKEVLLAMLKGVKDDE